ncbi:MAG: hypothetical protein GY869_18150 [Planctomycetes bacterium]|nr:hypothetical protein [Planctomycetota bacterium]
MLLNAAIFESTDGDDTFDYGWTATMGGNGNDNSHDIITDVLGNVFVTGNYFKTVDFDNSTGTDEHTSNGSADIFITKLGADGSYDWTATFGSDSWDRGIDLATDASGNVYATGYFKGAVDFDPGVGEDIHFSQGTNDVFVTKLNADGSYDWTRTIGSDQQDDGYGIAIDSSGAVIVAGIYSGTVDFDFRDGVEDTHTSNGAQDGFVTKWNADGSYGWTATWGGGSTDYVEDVAVDLSGNITVTGYFLNSVDFDPSDAEQEHTSNGSYDAFITRLSGDGSYQWTKTFGGTKWDQSANIGVDSAGNIFVAGTFDGSVDFDPSSGQDEQTTRGETDIFVIRLNADGSYGWARTFGGDYFDFGQSVTVSSMGSVLVTGYFWGTVDFDSSEEVDEHTSNGAFDVFVSKLNADGSYVWTATIGSSNYDYGNGIAVDFANNILVTGFFQETVDFDPTQEIDNHTSNSGKDVFVSKLFFQNINPVIETLSSLPEKAVLNDTMTLRASEADDIDGTITKVQFYRDSNNNRIFDPLSDVLLGEDVDGADNWNLTFAVDDFPVGYNAFFARAVDDVGAWSAVVSTSVEVIKDHHLFSYDGTVSAGADGIDSSRDISVDSLNNSITTGYFQGTVDFDPSGDEDLHTANGSYDVFITKINANGSYGWTVTFGGVQSDEGAGVAVDDENNIFVTGYFNDVVDFDSSAGVDEHSSTGAEDIFVIKLDPAGDYLWTRTLGGSMDDRGYGIATDVDGNVVVTGHFEDAVDFDPGDGVDIHLTDGWEDAFVLKLYRNSGYVWAATWGGGNTDRAVDVGVNSEGNTLVTGYFQQTVDFDFTDGVDNYSTNGSQDVYVLQLDVDGGYGWAQTWGGAGNDEPYGLAIDPGDNILVTGRFQQTVDFDPTADVDEHTSNGGWDVFVTKLNADTSYGWSVTSGGDNNDSGNDIATDKTGNVYTTGRVGGTVDFDPTSEEDIFITKGDGDAYVNMLYTDGSYGWTAMFSGNQDETGTGIAVDHMGHIYVSGNSANDFIDFDPTGTSDIEDTNFDIFMTRLTNRILTVAGGQDGYQTVKYTDIDGSNVTVKITQGLGLLIFEGDSPVLNINGKTASVIGSTAELRHINLLNSTEKTGIKLGVKSTNVDDGEATLGGISGEMLGKLNGKAIDLVGDINLTGGAVSVMLDDIAPNVSVSTRAATSKGLKLKADQIGQNVIFSIADTIKSFKVDGSLNNVIITAREHIKKVFTKGDIIDSYILAGYDMSIGGMQGLNNGDLGSVIGKGNFVGSFLSAGVLPPTPDLQDVLPGVQPPYTGLGYVGNIGKVKFGAIDQNATGDFGVWAASEIKSVKAGKIKYTQTDSQLHFVVEDYLG